MTGAPLCAWAMGASRGLDYLETDPAVDAKRVGIEGVSRYGKAALVAMAYEPGFAMVLVGSSGEGGGKLHRRNFGEAVENLTGSGNITGWRAIFSNTGPPSRSSAARCGRHSAGFTPAHRPVCAAAHVYQLWSPRTRRRQWLDQQGNFMAAVAAGPVFRLLGRERPGNVLTTTRKEKMPAVNTGLLDGALAWGQHDGGHTDTPNLEHFIKWANAHFDKTVAQNGAASAQ